MPSPGISRHTPCRPPSLSTTISSCYKEVSPLSAAHYRRHSISAWYRHREAATSLRICSLGSGSSGNATFVAGERTRLLIDAGFSFNEITKRLESIGEHPERLDAVLVSHEHSDHVKGLPQIAKRLQCPIYITELTEQTLDWGKIEPRLETFQAGQTIDIGEIAIDSFTIPHDAVDPVAFRVRYGGLQAGVVTDLGYMTESVKHKIRGCDLLVLESNHDLDMLKVGPYPWFVKQRVMSRVGHLSNHAVSQFLTTEFDLSCRWLVLAHLSKSNNHPEVARLFADTALRNKGAVGTRLVIAEQHRASEVFEL